MIKVLGTNLLSVFFYCLGGGGNQGLHMPGSSATWQNMDSILSSSLHQVSFLKEKSHFHRGIKLVLWQKTISAATTEATVRNFTQNSSSVLHLKNCLKMLLRVKFMRSSLIPGKWPNACSYPVKLEIYIQGWTRWPWLTILQFSLTNSTILWVYDSISWNVVLLMHLPHIPSSNLRMIWIGQVSLNQNG